MMRIVLTTFVSMLAIVAIEGGKMEESEIQSNETTEIKNSQKDDGSVLEAPSLLPPVEEQIKDQAAQKGSPASPDLDESDVFKGEVANPYECNSPRQLNGDPDVPISKDHTANIKSDVEYAVLLEKCKGTVCTFYYNGSDPKSLAMKNEIIELARKLNGKVTFAFVNSDEAKEYIDKARLGSKLPTIVLADNNKSYIHPYFSVTETKTLQSLIERYERGEKKYVPPAQTNSTQPIEQ